MFNEYYRTMFDDTAKHYEQKSNDYDLVLNSLVGNVYFHLPDLIKEYDIPKDAKIIDFSTGTGFFANALHDAGYTNITGCDGAQAMIDVAKSKAIFVDTFKHFVGEDKLNEKYYGEFTLAFCGASFIKNHVPALQGLNEMISLTKKGGILSIYTRQSSYDDEEYGLQTAIDERVGKGELRLMKSLTVPIFRELDGQVIKVIGTLKEQLGTFKFY